MEISTSVQDRMREDWNERAREDAHYYVAFGRRGQDDEEFLATAADVMRDLERELKRLRSDGVPCARRGLEIGCGPGRLMQPMSRHFDEIHGVDVSDEMIAQARENLRRIPHAHVRATSGIDLSPFGDGSFDFVYSCAVFQHIPNAAVVFNYLRETVRVLKPGGFARLQFCGLPESARQATTWEGVRIGAGEIRAFTETHNMRLLSLTGVDTQYMWTTWQKPPLRVATTDGMCRISQVSNAVSGEGTVSSSGSLACAALQIENLPEACDLNSLRAFADNVPGTGCYIGPALNRLRQFNVFLPPGVRTGLVPVRVEWRGEPLCPDAIARVIAPGPAVPRVLSVSDGVNLLSQQRIESRLLKVVLDDVQSLNRLSVRVDGSPAIVMETFLSDPRLSRWEVNLKLRREVAVGKRVLEIRLAARLLTRTEIEVMT